AVDAEAVDAEAAGVGDGSTCGGMAGPVVAIGPSSPNGFRPGSGTPPSSSVRAEPAAGAGACVALGRTSTDGAAPAVGSVGERRTVQASTPSTAQAPATRPRTSGLRSTPAGPVATVAVLDGPAEGRAEDRAEDRPEDAAEDGGEDPAEARAVRADVCARCRGRSWRFTGSERTGPGRAWTCRRPGRACRGPGRRPTALGS